jgi:NADPH:quinone reductase
MRAILRSGFGGPEVLEIREIPEPEPKAGHAVIEVKAFGINHAEMHMRKGEWAEIADVSGIECVGLIKSCLGGEFAIGTKVAALMGGLGRTINGSYAEFTRAPVSKVAAIESEPVVVRPRSHPGDVRHGLDLLVPQPGDRKRADAGDPRGDIVLRTGRSQHGREHGRAGYRHDAKPGAIRVARRTWRRACRSGGAGIVQADRRDQVARRGARPGGEQHDPRLSRHAAPRWPGLSGRVAGRPRADRRLQPAPADGERRLPHVLWQLRFRDAGVPVVGRSAAGDCGRRGGRPVKAKPSRMFRFEDIREAHRVMDAHQANGKMVVVV